LKTSPELFVVLYGRWSFNFTRGNLAENLTLISQWTERLALFEESTTAPAYIKDARFVVAMLEGPQLQSMGAIAKGREVMLSGLKLEDTTRYAAMMGHYGLNFAVSGRHWLAINLFTLRQDVVQIARHATTVTSLVSEHRIFDAFQHHANVYLAYALSCDDASAGVEQLQLLIDSGKGIPIFHLFDAQLLADALVRAGKPENAIETIHRFALPAKEKQLLINISESDRIKADALVSLGDPDEAFSYYESAISIAKKQEAGLYHLRASRAYAICLANLNKIPQARALLTDAVDSFIEGFNAIDYTEAQALLKLWNNPRTESSDDKR